MFWWWRGARCWKQPRVARGLTQDAVARRSGTSQPTQPTLSAYERGTKSPTFVERIIHTLDYELSLQPRVTFREVPAKHGAPSFLVLDQLWRVDPPGCFGPLTVRNANGDGRSFDVLNRDGRVDAYVWLLRHGDETELFWHLDGELSVNPWPDIGPQLPRDSAGTGSHSS